MKREKYCLGQEVTGFLTKANQTVRTTGTLVGWTVSGKAVIQNSSGCYFARIEPKEKRLFSYH